MDPTPSPSPGLSDADIANLLAAGDERTYALLIAFLAVFTGSAFLLYRLSKVDGALVVSVGLVFLTFGTLILFTVVRDSELLTIAATGVGALATATTARFAISKKNDDEPPEDEADADGGEE